MASAQVDLNAGGVDLKFPHHENQIAQCEAHFNCCNWVNYFLHSGHLQIEGLKMSKSLKNFITIRGALDAYSPSVLRFLVLLRHFSKPMEYSENTLAAAADLEKRFASFGASLAQRLKEAAAAADAQGQQQGGAPRTAGAGGPPIPGAPPSHKWGAEERELHATLVSRRAAVHTALLDSIDTPTALKALEQLIRATNVYMGAVPDVTRGATLLTLVQRYHSKMMGVFGLAPAAGAGSAAGAGAGAAGAGGASAQDVAEALGSFRDQLRQLSIATVKGDEGGGGGAPLAAELLRICDALRDEELPSLGVQLDDRPSGVAQIKIGDPKLVMAEAARKAEAAAKAAAEKEAKAAARAAAAAAEAARAAVPPVAMFGAEHDGLFEREAPFGAWDVDGVPTESAEGEPLSKSQRKKLLKQRDKQAKAHEAYLARQ